MKKGIIGVIGIILFLPNLAMAGKYKMIEDSMFVPQPNGITKVEEHAEVCTAFLKNLEAFPPFPPMACDVKFKPEFTDFKTPEWQDIDVWENRALYMQTFQTPPASETEKEHGLVNLKAHIEAGMIALRTTQFDIDNDGVTEQILEVSNGKKCDPASKNKRDTYHYGYRIYDLETQKVDTEKNKFYDVYGSDDSLFSYKGTTYYAELFGGSTNKLYFGKLERPGKDGLRPTKYYIRLYRPILMNQGIKQPVALGCEYLYLPTNNEGGY